MSGAPPNLLAGWRCNRCGDVVTTPSKPEDPCSNCGGRVWRAIRGYACAGCAHAVPYPGSDTGLACRLEVFTACRPYSQAPRHFKPRRGRTQEGGPA